MQAQRYSSLAFILAFVGITGLLVATAYLGLATGLFNHALERVGDSSPGRTLLVTCFLWIALTVCPAYWVFATRKIYNRRFIVSAFLLVLFGGAAASWFSVEPFASLPGEFIGASILAGLGGGWLLVKSVKFHKDGISETPRPLILSEHLDWNRGASRVVLMGGAIALGSIATLLLTSGVDLPLVFLFLILTALNALWPVCLLAGRLATGKLRELCVSISIGALLVISIAVAFVANTLFSNIAWSIPIGLTGALTLIGFGRMRRTAVGNAKG
jgi:hypothetical protein